MMPGGSVRAGYTAVMCMMCVMMLLRVRERSNNTRMYAQAPTKETQTGEEEEYYIRKNHRAGEGERNKERKKKKIIIIHGDVYLLRHSCRAEISDNRYQVCVAMQVGCVQVVKV